MSSGVEGKIHDTLWQPQSKKLREARENMESPTNNPISQCRVSK